ncbi:hypothetical protein DESPIG_01207 [Desulfovibrio piger ATCC 29098]|uniref:Uncharacterized protein n=1 Tax=Desulfovibrio piger ATCC 29098 TaxID=411464 RepID=B6WT04_9BACT|nr:hypothetical protein DESPIG_01207 [Desulfovibrio piger ATCC 29098]
MLRVFSSVRLRPLSESKAGAAFFLRTYLRGAFSMGVENTHYRKTAMRCKKMLWDWKKKGV